MNWADVTGSTQRLGLGEVRWLDGTGPLGGTATTGWSRTALGHRRHDRLGRRRSAHQWLGGIHGLCAPGMAAVDRPDPGRRLAIRTAWARRRSALPGCGSPSSRATPTARSWPTCTTWTAGATATSSRRLRPAGSARHPNAALGGGCGVPGHRLHRAVRHRLALVVDTEDALYLGREPVGSADHVHRSVLARPAAALADPLAADPPSVGSMTIPPVGVANHRLRPSRAPSSSNTTLLRGLTACLRAYRLLIGYRT